MTDSAAPISNRHAPSDGALIAAVARGDDPDAVRRLVERHQDWVYAVALRGVRDPGLAADCAQATFLLLWRKAHRLADADDRAVASWLFRTTRNHVSNARRLRQRRQEHEREAAMQRPTGFAATPPTDAFDHDALLAALDRAIERLSNADRAVILLRFFKRQQFAEVALALRTTEGAARKHVSRAVLQLRQHLLSSGVAIAPATLTTALGGVVVVPAPTALLSPTPSATAKALVASTVKSAWSGGIAIVGMVSSIILTVSLLVIFIPERRAQPTTTSLPLEPPPLAHVTADEHTNNTVTEPLLSWAKLSNDALAERKKITTEQYEFSLSEWSSDNAQEMRRSLYVKFWRDGEKFRTWAWTEIRGRTPRESMNDVQITTFDGEYGRHRSGRYRGVLRVSTRSSSIDAVLADVRLHLCGFGIETVNSQLDGGSLDILEVRRDKLNGRDAIRVVIDVLATGSRVTQWYLPDQGYVCVRTEDRNRAGTLEGVVSVDEIGAIKDEAGNTHFFPQRGKRDLLIGGKVTRSYTLEVNPKTVKLSDAIDAALFQLKRLPNERIYDLDQMRPVSSHPSEANVPATAATLEDVPTASIGQRTP